MTSKANRFWLSGILLPVDGVRMDGVSRSAGCVLYARTTASEEDVRCWVGPIG